MIALERISWYQSPGLHQVLLGSALVVFVGVEGVPGVPTASGPGAVNRYGQRVPPYRETQDYVQKITRKTDTMPVARAGRTVIYKVLEEVDGQPQWRLTDTRPKSGRYEVIR